MEDENCQYMTELKDSDKDLYRSYMNMKIDIYQQPGHFVMRDNKMSKFYDSFEHREMQKSSAKILSSSSHLLVYSLAKGYDSVNQAQHQLKKVFNTTTTDEYSDYEEIEKKYNEFHNSVMRKKLENDTDFLQLSSFISHLTFNQLMQSNISFRRYILNHKYIKYHPKYKEIYEKFGKFIIPTNGVESEADVEMEMEESEG